MANTAPATVVITVADINGNSVAKTFVSVRSMTYDFFGNRVTVDDATGRFHFAYGGIATVTHVVAGGVTTVTIS